MIIGINVVLMQWDVFIRLALYGTGVLGWAAVDLLFWRVCMGAICRLWVYVW